MTTLCDLATRLPVLVGALLDRETKLKRGRFREETLTDIFTAALAAFAGPSLVIEYPDETATGGDLDLDFWHVSSGRHLRLRIQAKRLNAEQNNGTPVKIKHRSYRELLHHPPKATKYQFETLVALPRSFLPLYMFYNHGAVTRDLAYAGLIPAVRGINLAFADDVATDLKAKLAAKGALPPKVLHYKRLSHLRPYFFDLATILCPAGDSGEEVPSPDSVAEALRGIWMRDADETASIVDEQIARKLSMLDELTQKAVTVRRISDGPSVRFVQNIERPVVTFISGRTKDDRTPLIYDDLLVG